MGLHGTGRFRRDKDRPALYPYAANPKGRRRGVCRIPGMIGMVAILMALLAALVAGCGSPAESPSPTPAPEATSGAPSPTQSPAPPALELGALRLEQVQPLGVIAPTNFVQDAGGRFLITEQEGRLRVLEQDQLDIEHLFVPAPMDITGRVSSRGSEEGLLGLAPSPHNERHLFLYYSAANPRRSVVSRFNYNREVAPESELVILEVEQPYRNHNGGQIAFGPDGYLYIGLGDGGSAGDPQGNGQDTSTLLGSILRIDVSESTPDQPYAIPPDNPYVNGGGRPEIWAYGLRNPWRFSFDRETGDLWTGDVGQNEWEEIDIIEKGGNYGWNVLEGDHCFRPRDDCDREGRVPAVWEYSLDGEPCSVIGGYVYRGSAIPWLQGVYIYGDFCSGKVFGLRYENGRVTEHKQLADTNLNIMSFAEDNTGELYLLSQREGVYRLTD